MLLLFLYVSFLFSANLRREMTISRVIKRTWTHSSKFEFSFLPWHRTSKFSAWVVLLAFKSYTRWDNDEKDWHTWTCNFERRFRNRCVVNLKLPFIRKKSDLCKNIRVSDDLIWEDREKKKQLEFIVNAFELDERLSTWQFIYWRWMMWSLRTLRLLIRSSIIIALEE